MASGTPIPSLSATAAERLQGDVTPADLRLTAQAVMLRRGVVWWWGVRRNSDGNIARCYICNAQLASWDGRHPMPRRAIDAVLAHRDSHIRGDSPAS